jgi:hypothetical protein
MWRALHSLLCLLCATTCACSEDVMHLGKSEAVTEMSVESLLLRDAATGSVIADLASAVPISIASLASTDVSLEAVVTGNVGSVAFVIDGKMKTEHVPPFTYPGDTDGKLDAFTAARGEHSVVATPYSLLDAKGEQGTALSRTLNFVN